MTDLDYFVANVFADPKGCAAKQESAAEELTQLQGQEVVHRMFVDRLDALGAPTRKEEGGIVTITLLGGKLEWLEKEIARLRRIEAAAKQELETLRALAESHHINMQARGNKSHPGDFENCLASTCRSGRESIASLAAALGGDK